MDIYPPVKAFPDIPAEAGVGTAQAVIMATFLL
jgi:hypothetical protein